MSSVLHQPLRRLHRFTAAVLLPCLALTGPAAAAGADETDTASPAPPEDRFTYLEANMEAMWIKQMPTPTGGTSPFTVRVARNTSGDAAVGLIERIFGGAGDSWKSSAWIAAVAASNTTNHLITDYEFLVKVHGFIDGPSAGMLMAATMIALMKDEQKSIRPHVTITGTINPDGTIGPIGGLRYKIEGAKKAGITEIGYPLIDNGSAENYVADMDALAKSYGIKAVPIGNVFEAYKFLTGRTLGSQRPATLDPAELSFSPSQLARLLAATRSLLDETKTRMAAVVEQQNKFTKAGPAAKKSFQDDRKRTDDYLLKAEEFYVRAKSASVAKDPSTAGDAMMARSRAMIADQSARLAEKEVLWQLALAKKDGNALTKVYDETLLQVKELVGALETTMPNGLDSPGLAGRIAGLNNRLQYWVAYSQWLAASAGGPEIEARKVALQNAANGKPRTDEATLKQMSDDIAKAMLKTLQRLALLEGQIRADAELARFPVDDNSLPAPDLTGLNRRLAEAYGPAAAAGLAYFESTAVGLRAHGGEDDPLLQHLKVQLSTDTAYGAYTAAALRAVRVNADPSQAESPAAILDRLACGAHAYLGMAALMNKYYNLFDDSSVSSPAASAQVINLRKGQTVERMIQSSRARVLEEAAEVKKQLPFIPDCIKMSFTLAEAKRSEPGDQAKLDALTSYWRAHFLCRMVQMMAKAR
jgi:hypothetical protein